MILQRHAHVPLTYHHSLLELAESRSELHNREWSVVTRSFCLCSTVSFQTFGLLVGAMIVASRVTRGLSQPHEFVFFITYLAQVSPDYIWNTWS